MAFDQSEDDDYIRHLSDRITAISVIIKLKFRLSTLLFIMACLGVIFAPLQFLRLEDTPIVFGLGVSFMSRLGVMIILVVRSLRIYLKNIRMHRTTMCCMRRTRRQRFVCLRHE